MKYDVTAHILFGPLADNKKERKTVTVKADSGDQAAAAGHSMILEYMKKVEHIRSFTIAEVTPSPMQSEPKASEDVEIEAVQEKAPTENEKEIEEMPAKKKRGRPKKAA